MKRKGLTTLILAAAISALMFSAPAEAGHKHNNKVRVHRGQSAAPLFFHAPARMLRGHRAEYRPFFTGNFYFGPHRHYHAIYVFPVQTRHGVVYREFEYCSGDIFIRNQISYRGKNVSFNIGF